MPPPQEHTPEPAAPTPPDGAPAPPRSAPPTEVNDEVELMLADARARAHELIEQSVERAQDLIRERRSTEPLGIGRLRRTVDDLTIEVRSIHQRLDGLEALLRTLVAERAAVQQQPVAPPTPVYQQPVVALPASAVPPQAQAPAPSPQPPPSPARAEATRPTIAPNGTAANGTIFTADVGSIILRVSPVAGFQGLMRVQDALAHVHGVREAGVEAYAQGEARLRLQLADDVASDRLAAAVGEHLGRPARVAAASVPDRSIQLTLE